MWNTAHKWIQNLTSHVDQTPVVNNFFSNVSGLKYWKMCWWILWNKPRIKFLPLGLKARQNLISVPLLFGSRDNGYLYREQWRNHITFNNCQFCPDASLSETSARKTVYSDFFFRRHLKQGLDFWEKKYLSRYRYRGLPWWRSGYESACQCRGRGFNPWSGKIPHADEQLSLCATTTDPAL